MPRRHPNNMPLDPKKLQDPLRKLRKSLKKLASHPSPEEVHDIRTRSRKLEAILHALMLDAHKPGQRLLGSVAPIARVLEANTRGKGYLQGNGYVVTWAIGHLVCHVSLAS